MIRKFSRELWSSMLLHEYLTEHFPYLISIQEELDDIIRYGSKELFADENDEAGKSRQIHYDDAAIER